MEIIPAIDLLEGRCVRLYQGDFGKVSRYETDPLELARAYRAAGLRRLHVVDLDGARNGVPSNLATIRRIAADSGMAVQAGGGIRDRARLTELFATGVERAVLGSVAILDPTTVSEWFKEMQPEQLLLAFDVRLDERSRDPVAMTHGWREASGQVLWELVDLYLPLGALDFLCTDIGRDGTLAGPNTVLYRECVRRYPQARFIASGGIGKVADLRDLATTGVAGVVTGKALLEGRLTLQELEQFLRDA